MSKPQIILHHYELSPFSEKMRTLLGYCDLPWQSVVVSPNLPRPELMQLTGGYRKIPVMQVGADIYCDTRLISRKLVERCNRPELIPADRPEILELSAWADTRLFQIALTCSMGRQVFTNLKHFFTLRSAIALTWDRIMFTRGANLPRIGPKRARQELHGFLARLDRDLTRDFIFGDSPTIADFSTYHPLHFSQIRCGAGHLDHYPNVLAWLQRMMAIGHGQRTEISCTTSLSIAKAANPVVVTGSQFEAFGSGSLVSIRPADYGVTPVQGRLVAADELSWTLASQVNGLGEIHVHFPKTGFAIAEISA